MINIQEKALTEELKKQILGGFSQHALQMTGHDGKNETIVFVAMDDSIFAGAVAGEIFWGSLHIKYVYVTEAYRGKGIGKKLMEKAFAFGREHACPFAFVETMSFQALGFYQKLGFVLEFTRYGYAKGTSFHYLRKDF